MRKFIEMHKNATLRYFELSDNLRMKIWLRILSKCVKFGLSERRRNANEEQEDM